MINLLFNTIVLPNINYAYLSTQRPSPILHLYNVSKTAVLKGNMRLSLKMFMIS